MRLMPFWIEGLDILDILSYLKKYSHDASFRKALRKQLVLNCFCLVIVVSLGLPYLKKQKSGQWMATLHQAKFMGFSIIYITKSGRPSSFVSIQGRASKN